MKPFDYVASLLPTFTKNRVIEDARATREELDDVVAPSYEQALKVFTRYKFKTEELDVLENTFHRMHPHASENMVVSIEKGMKEILKNIKDLEEVIERTYNNDVAGMGLSYRKANLLQLLEAYTFVSRYARKFLTYAYVCETALLDAAGQSVKPEVASEIIKSQTIPADVDYLKQNIVYFSNCFLVCAGLGKHKDLSKVVEDIPDVVITKDNEHTLTATQGIEKVDPFRMGFIPVWLNPVYHVGMLVAEWQAGRYKAAQEELRTLQLRKLNLEKKLEGKSDAKIEQQIAYMQKRVDDLEYRLVKMEKKG